MMGKLSPTYSPPMMMMMMMMMMMKTRKQKVKMMRMMKMMMKSLKTQRMWNSSKVQKKYVFKYYIFVNFVLVKGMEEESSKF